MRDTMNAYYLRRMQKPYCCIDLLHSKYNSLNINIIQEILESQNSTRLPGEDDKRTKCILMNALQANTKMYFLMFLYVVTSLLIFLSLHSTRYQQKINIGKAEQLKKE